MIQGPDNAAILTIICTDTLISAIFTDRDFNVLAIDCARRASCGSSRASDMFRTQCVGAHKNKVPKLSLKHLERNYKPLLAFDSVFLTKLHPSRFHYRKARISVSIDVLRILDIGCNLLEL